MSMYRSNSPAPVSPSLCDVQACRSLFGSMIQEGRQAIGRSIEEAARLAGMEASEWAAIEAGHIPADLGRLRSMASALEIRYGQLILVVHLCQEAWAE